MCIVDQDGVCVANVYSAFDNRRRHQNIVPTFDEASHHVFELLALHLSMAYAYSDIRT